MATTPIPPNPIGESFVWRDWFQRLSDRVFGTASTLDVPIQPEYGGTGMTTYSTGNIIYCNSTDNLTRLAPPASTSVLQMTSAGVPSWAATLAVANGGTGASTASAARTNLGLGSGYNGSVALAKITIAGTDGSLTVTNGIITAYTAPT